MWTSVVNRLQLRGKVFELRVSNRTIWMLWFQGFADASPLVQVCLESWRRSNPTWRVVALNRTSLSEWVDFEQAIDPERRDLDMRRVADVARLCLLRQRLELAAPGGAAQLEMRGVEHHFRRLKPKSRVAADIDGARAWQKGVVEAEAVLFANQRKHRIAENVEILEID